MILTQMDMIGNFLPGEVFTEMGENIFFGLLGIALTFSALLQIIRQGGDGAENPGERIGNGIRCLPEAAGIFAAIKKHMGWHMFFAHDAVKQLDKIRMKSVQGFGAEAVTRPKKEIGCFG